MVLIILKEVPLAPLIEVSRVLNISEATLRVWIRKEIIKAYPAIRTYQKSSLNLIDLDSLAIHLRENTEALIRKLQTAGVMILVRAVVE